MEFHQVINLLSRTRQRGSVQNNGEFSHVPIWWGFLSFYFYGKQIIFQVCAIIFYILHVNSHTFKLEKIPKLYLENWEVISVVEFDDILHTPIYCVP